MRRLLQLFCVSLLLAGSTLLAPTARPAGATDDSSTTDSSTTEPASSTDSTTTSSTVPSSSLAPASRGTAVQVAPTFPAPTAAPTLPPPPPPPSPLAVPANSGNGRRVVYSKSRMRVWVIEANGQVSRTYLVSGRLNQPNPGTYSVFSRSSYTCSIKSSSTCMRWMVRFTKGPSGDNIGFHEIPRKNGVPLQSDAQLGQALSAGCVRQSTADAQFMWAWAGIGTKVIVIW